MGTHCSSAVGFSVCFSGDDDPLSRLSLTLRFLKRSNARSNFTGSRVCRLTHVLIDLGSGERLARVSGTSAGRGSLSPDPCSKGSLGASSQSELLSDATAGLRGIAFSFGAGMLFCSSVLSVMFVLLASNRIQREHRAKLQCIHISTAGTCRVSALMLAQMRFHLQPSQS